METYRLKSRLVGSNREYVIQTTNDADLAAVTSTVIVNGVPTETIRAVHPTEIGSEEVLSLVKSRHGEVKKEFEGLLSAFEETIAGADCEKLTRLGIAFFHKRLFAEAQELFGRALQEDRNQHKVHNYLGQTLSALGRGEEAAEAASQAVTLRPTFADYRNNLGLAWVAAGKYAKAAAEFSEATKINMYYAEAYFNLGLVLVRNALEKSDARLFDGVLSRAAEQFNRARLIQAEFDSAGFREGLRALEASDLNTAHRLMEQLQAERTESHRQQYSQYYMNSALSVDFGSEEALNERIAFLRAEIQKNPTYVDLVTELGRCFLQKARWAWSQGIEQYRTAIEKNPSLDKSLTMIDQAERVNEVIGEFLDMLGQKDRTL